MALLLDAIRKDSVLFYIHDGRLLCVFVVYPCCVHFNVVCPCCVHFNVVCVSLLCALQCCMSLLCALQCCMSLLCALQCCMYVLVVCTSMLCAPQGSVSACLRHVDLQGNDFSNLSSSALLRLFSPLSMTSIKLSNVSCTFLSSLQQTLSSVKVVAPNSPSLFSFFIFIFPFDHSTQGELSLRHFRINGQTAICGEVM